MTDRKTVSTINDLELTELYDQLDTLRAVARGYCPACGRGDAAPTVADWEQQKQRADRLEITNRALNTAAVEAVERAEQTETERGGAYRERAHLLAWLAALHPTVIAPAPDIDEPGWQLLYLDASGWQLSWHIAPRDADLFAHVEHVPAADPRAQWDGHTTEEKYERIRQLAAADGPGPDEPDTCRTVDIDGETIRVRGAGEMSDESRAALADVIRAARRKYAAEHPETAPREHCGHLSPQTLLTTPPTECVLRPGHHGSHADDRGARWLPVPDHDRLVESGVHTPGCDCGHDGMGISWHSDDCPWRRSILDGTTPTATPAGLRAQYADAIRSALGDHLDIARQAADRVLTIRDHEIDRLRKALTDTMTVNRRAVGRLTDRAHQAEQQRDRLQHAIDGIRRFNQLTTESCRAQAAEHAHDNLQILDTVLDEHLGQPC